MKTSRNENTETQELQNVPSGLTLNMLLEKTKAKMGDKKFFTYNAVSNNCQDFLLAFLQSNNLGTETNYTFIKQDTKSLFDRLPVLKKLAKGTTDLGAAVGNNLKLSKYIHLRGLLHIINALKLRRIMTIISFVCVLSLFVS